jgi:hypothetical protein
MWYQVDTHTADRSDLEDRHQHTAVTKAECRIKKMMFLAHEDNTYCDWIKRNLIATPPEILYLLPQLIQQAGVNKCVALIQLHYNLINEKPIVTFWVQSRN